MARPRERTYAYGSVPYEDRPWFCFGCGKVTRWTERPDLVDRFSEEPPVREAMDDLRGIALPDSMTMRPTPEREGGLVHRHGHMVNDLGEDFEQEVGGGSCQECADKQLTRHYEATGNKAALAKLFARRHLGREAASSETLADVAPPSEADATAFLGATPKKHEEE